MSHFVSSGNIFIAVGTPIERCPVCDAKVCRVIVERKSTNPVWKLVTLPDPPFSLDGEFSVEHGCPGALNYLQNPPVPIKPKCEENAVERIERTSALDLSNCCEAPIDYSQVIEKGRYKNHGPRYCSKCNRCLYLV